MKLYLVRSFAGASLFGAWGDLSLTKGTYSLTQPTIRPFDTKQFQDVLML
jgi:hypothetical protein